MSKHTPPFQRDNTFSQAYGEFQKTALFQRLSRKYALKPYYERYSGVRKLAYISSYAFNVLSAISACGAVYFFLKPYLNNLILSVAITIVFMGLLEMFKRTTASRFLESVFQFSKYPIGLCAVVFGLTTLSILFSYNGSKQFIFQLADPPVQVNMDSYTEEYKKEIAAIDKQIIAARETTYKGITTRTSQRTIDKLTDQRKELQDRIFGLEDQIRGENKQAFEQHIVDTKGQAYYFALFTLCCEFLFLFCLGYLEYYDFRSYGEFAKVQDKRKLEPIPQEQLPQLKSIIRGELVALINESKRQKIATKPEEKVVTQKVEQKTVPQADLTLKESHQESTNQIATQKSKASSSAISKKQEPIIENPERVHILTAIKKAKSRINSAEFRLKRNIGKRTTSEQNRLEAEQELLQLEKRLREMKNGYQVKM